MSGPAYVCTGTRFAFAAAFAAAQFSVCQTTNAVQHIVDGTKTLGDVLTIIKSAIYH
jgi:hypothetical protein